MPDHSASVACYHRVTFILCWRSLCRCSSACCFFFPALVFIMTSAPTKVINYRRSWRPSLGAKSGCLLERRRISRRTIYVVKSWVILTRLKRRALRRRLISYLEIRSCEWLSRHWWLLRRALNWLSYVIQRIDYLVEPLSQHVKTAHRAWWPGLRNCGWSNCSNCLWLFMPDVVDSRLK